MSDKPWKKAEREIAALFGTKRRPLSGMTHHTHGTGNDDIEHDQLYVECKQTGSLKSNLNPVCKLMNETVARAELEDKIPIVALRRTTMNDPDPYLVIKSSDLHRLLAIFSP